MIYEKITDKKIKILSRKTFPTVRIQTLPYKKGYKNFAIQFQDFKNTFSYFLQMNESHKQRMTEQNIQWLVGIYVQL